MGKVRVLTGSLRHIIRLFFPLLSYSIYGYFNSIAGGGTIPPEALLAHIMVLPKEGKDPTVPQSYRPICFLNVDIKILAKRLKHLMLHIIHLDKLDLLLAV